jgi:hypothetical protein
MDNGSILLSSPKIAALVANPSGYLQFKIEATINCCPELFSHTFAIPLVDTTLAVFNGNSIEVKPLFFNVIIPNLIRDGIYWFRVKIFTDANNYTYEEDCAFMDVTYKCKVAGYIDNLNDTIVTEDKQISTNVHLLHYALTNGSNCGCNCTSLCDVFTELTKLITPITPQQRSCGC